jgi:hypothetical protein
MSQYPTQTRAVDPFASYNSDVVNRLTRMVTQGEDLLFSPRGMDVAADSTSPNDYVNVTVGSCFKDDTWIQITEEHQVDFTNALHYFGGAVIKEPGYYYIVLEYEFVKSRPAPQASIKIIPPSLIATGYGSNHVFLKAVAATTGPWAIGTLYDYDPDDTSIYRQNTSTWASVEYTLPTFDRTTDQGRIIYVQDADMYYFGIYNTWERLDDMGTRITMATSSVLNSLVYFNGTVWVDAIASSETTFAQAVVTEVGAIPKGRWAGRLTVNVQAAITISAGDFVYLSSTEAGTATNVKTSQQVGVALTGGTGTVSILFFPAVAAAGSLRFTIPFTIGSGGNYYHMLDITPLAMSSISDACHIQCWDNSTHEEIEPLLIERQTIDSIRIWMPVNTITLDIIVTG